MKKSFRINIPSPCLKQWDEMAPSENGRYCGHCKTEVVNFSGWTEKDIADFVLSNKTKVCGRLSTRPIISTKAAVTATGFSLLTFLSITSVLSLAYVRNSDGKLTVFPNTRYSVEGFRDLNSHQLERSDSTTIKGQVIGKDENGIHPLNGVHIRIKGKSGGSVSDRNGYFQFQTLKGKERRLTLTMNYLGFKRKEIKLRLPKEGFLDIGTITMREDINIIIGEVFIIPRKKSGG